MIPRCWQVKNVILHKLFYFLGGPNAEFFRNRKGFFSLNVQAVCNANLEITDIVARWPGSVHDSTIFHNSRLRANFENHMYRNALILGDSGYPSKSYLLTPLLNPERPAEIVYNQAHIRTRNIIERLFGVWKRRFPILALGMRYKLQRIMTIIVATAVLHNIARRNADEDPPEDPTLNLPAPWDHIINEGCINNEINVQNNANATRTQIINDYFQR